MSLSILRTALASLCVASLCTAVTVDVRSAVASVPDTFVSVTIDVSNANKPDFNLNFSNKATGALAEQWAPSWLRVGGTDEDFIFYDMQDDSPLGSNPPSPPANTTIKRSVWEWLVGFAKTSGWEMVFGLNSQYRYNESTPHLWNPSNASGLLEFTKNMPADKNMVVGWELGNENNLRSRPSKNDTAEQLAGKFKTFVSLVDQIYDGKTGGGTTSSPWLIGPDSTDGGSGVDYFGSFLESCLESGIALSKTTWHFYWGGFQPIDLIKPNVLDEFLTKALQIQSLYETYKRKSPKPVQLWLGETGACLYHSPGQTPTGFAGSIITIDKHGIAALTGHEAVFRQQYSILLGRELAAVTPDPALYTSILWKRTMGGTVLNVTNALTMGRSVRVYAHCSTAGDGGVTLAAVNLNPTQETVELGCVGCASSGLSGSKALVFDIRPSNASDYLSATVTVNGAQAGLGSDFKVPMWAPAVRNPSKTLELGPYSTMFATFPDAGAAICKK